MAGQRTPHLPVMLSRTAVWWFVFLITFVLRIAVLRLIRQTIDAGHAKGKWVGMCGELAGMTKAIPILLGLGLDEFSMNPRAIPEAKHLIGRLTDEDARRITGEAMSKRTAMEIEDYMKGVLALL